MEARKEKARTVAMAAAEKMRAKISADINALKVDIAHKKHDVDVKLAESYANQLESDASFAISYAISSIEQAEWAVLDAVVARAKAQKAKAA